MARLAEIVIDCLRPASLARFWEAVLDDYQIAAYDTAELQRLAAMGITDTEDDPTVLLAPADAGPRIWFQQVPESKTTKNRLHLDVRAHDVQLEVARLIRLGAESASQQHSDGLVVLCDPEGNEFCVIA